jgi:hypothetical protein
MRVGEFISSRDVLVIDDTASMSRFGLPRIAIIGPGRESIDDCESLNCDWASESGVETPSNSVLSKLFEMA